ncbi:hypothetical protein Zmor_027760 [Zophobas morio]|uniref:Uncharacterized protein n=1 Tax=Zophobas morio TaxID=2755281 RepID=A0AA38HQC5_9CUCU|nr:hypothetical protein Zmor_027760 [Zophobas morio]
MNKIELLYTCVPFPPTLHKVAKIRVNPIDAITMVCPHPQNSAYRGFMGKLEARYTNAIAALLTIPVTAGATIPINSIANGKNFPNLCFLRVRNAIKPAKVCTTNEEKNDQRKTWYHILMNVLSESAFWNQNTVPMESSSMLFMVVPGCVGPWGLCTGAS